MIRGLDVESSVIFLSDKSCYNHDVDRVTTSAKDRSTLTEIHALIYYDYS